MKFLKTLAVIFAMLALTVGAVAAEVVYESFKLNDLVVTMPEGMEYTITQQGDCINIVIDSSNTKWDLVATQADRWGEVVIDFEASFPEGASYVSGTTGFDLNWNKDWTYEAMKEDCYDPCYEHLTYMMSASSVSGGGQLPIATYSESLKTIVPTSYSGSRVAYLMCVFFTGRDPVNELGTGVVEARYTTIRVTYSDENARSVERYLVPAERIAAANGADDLKVSDGSVFYTFNRSVNDGMTLDTVITPPAGAKSFRAKGYYNIDIDNPDLPNAGAAKDQTVQISVEGESDFDFNCPVFYWYDGPFDEVNKRPTGNLIRVESMNIFMKLGDPKPWPNYLSEEEGKKLTGDDLAFVVAKADGTEAGFASVAFENSTGTATVSGTGAAVPSEDLTAYKLFTEVDAPSGARYYASSTLFDSVLLGDYYTINGYMAHNRALNRPTFEDVPSDRKVRYEDNLLNLTTYANDQGLKVYYDDNPTMFYTGAVTFIDWYNSDYEEIGRVWFVTRFDTLANIVTTDVEPSIPTNATAPTLVTADAGNGFELQVTSYPQTSETGTQIHYELTLLKDGAEVPLDELSSEGVTLFIPFPSTVENTDAITFAVNHYNSAGNLVDSFVETGDSTVMLTREANGVTMTVESLSPFVLSWEEADSLTAAADLPKTGDSSNLFLYALLCCVSLAGIMLLRRKSRA